jgi:uncharacterized protein
VLTFLSGTLTGSLAGFAWYYTDKIRKEGLLPGIRPAHDLRVLDVGDGFVELDASRRRGHHGDWMQPGLWGLETDSGYARVNDIIESHMSHVRRSFQPVSGEIRVGEPARLDVFVYRGDPRTARGIPFEEVTIQGCLGPMPAWKTAGDRKTWVIFVHGKGSSRAESLRFLPLIGSLSLPSLTITYRNDPEAPPDPSGHYQYGKTEWEDLEAAVAYALRDGALDVVLYGLSMGAGVVLSFLCRSNLASRVAAVILDSPMLDFVATLRHGAAQHRVPLVLTEIARRVSTLRFGVDWQSLDYLRRADELTAPILLFHTEADHYTPIQASDRLARRRPDIVRYERFTVGGHTRIWNAAPQAYEAALRRFLADVAP